MVKVAFFLPKISRIFLAILLLLSILTQGSAQEQAQDTEDPGFTAAQHLWHLKDGVLLIRLPSFRNQLEALEKRGASKRKINQLLEDRNQFSRHIITAFQDTFDYCKVLFVFDTAMTRIIDGQRSGFCLDDSLLSVNSALEIPSDLPVYTLRLGVTDYATTARRTSFIFTDVQGNDLRKPFPYARSIYNLEPMNLKRLFRSSDYIKGMDARWAGQIVGGIQARLQKFESQLTGGFSPESRH